jgi:NADPH:quinone reductase
MKAIRVHSFGDPSVLQLEEVETPRPGRGDVLVRIKAIGVNYMDVYARTGRYGAALPYIPGAEASGTVEALGQEVRGVAKGDRVAYTGIPAAYAEFSVVPAERLIALPDWMSFEVGAAFPLQGMTAHYLAHEYYHIAPGTAVLIHAVAGGVGLLAAQIAKHLGARVIGTTSSEQKASAAKEVGADDVILYTKTNFVEEAIRLTNGRGVDLILDGVGKSTFAGDLQAVRVRGTVVIFGSSSGPAEPIAPNSLQARSLLLGGGRLLDFIATREELERRAGDVMNAIHAGWLQVKISRVLPLAQASEAHRLLESRETIGKLVLTP